MDRREDARKKIQLGGLLVKAELDHMHPAEAYILYGMLLDCKRAMQEKPAVKERWAKMGKELLVGERQPIVIKHATIDPKITDKVE